MISIQQNASPMRRGIHTTEDKEMEVEEKEQAWEVLIST